MKNQSISVSKAIKFAKKEFRAEHGRRIPNHALISCMPRYGGGRYILIAGAGLTSEFYFN